MHKDAWQDRYLSGFRANPAHYYCGISALTLMHLAHHLGADTQPEEALRTLAGAVHFTAESENERASSFWALTTLADLEVLEGSCQEAKAAYRRTIAKQEMDRFALHSCCDNLLLQALGFRPEVVSAAIATLDRAIERTAQGQQLFRPRLVLLFSGHMMDGPDRAEPLFPPAKEAAALEEIEAALGERVAAILSDQILGFYCLFLNSFFLYQLRSAWFRSRTAHTASAQSHPPPAPVRRWDPRSRSSRGGR